jgi:initiation factor 1A
MGKNKSGGNKQKGMQNDTQDYNVIFKQDDSQIYAIVTKNLGNSSFQVADQHNNLYIAHVRGKMKGRAKRKFFINIYDILLVQFRQFASNKNITDIIQIYNQNHYTRIHNYQILNNIKNNYHNKDYKDNKDNNDIAFNNNDISFNYQIIHKQNNNQILNDTLIQLI